MERCLVEPEITGIRRFLFSRLALKVAAFDIFALFSAWYHAHLEFVKQLIDLGWAHQLRMPTVIAGSNPNVLYPQLIVIAACLLAALYLSNMSRYRRGRFGANMRRFQEANAHADAIDRRIASSKVMFQLPERLRGPVRENPHEPVAWRPPPGLLPEQSK
jgi:hypothetical protein